MPPYAFSRSARLTGRSAFRDIYEARACARAGPLTVWTRPNGLDHGRLGISIGRRAGTAVRRNRIKRRLRESFRLLQRDWPDGYDVVVNVRGHEPLPLAEYQRLLHRAIRDLHRRWTKRRARADSEPPAPPPVG